jgi:hypothetical protein
VIPNPINWQVKESLYGIGGAEKTDSIKLIKVIREGDYKGYLPVETLMVRNISYDSFVLVLEILKELEDTMIR